MTDTHHPYEIPQQSEEKPDVLKLIYLYHDQCKTLLKVFHHENLKLEDVASARDDYGLFPIHNVLLYCWGEGVLELVRYLVELDPDCVKRKTHAGLLPIHVMPGMPLTVESTRLDVIQNDQLQARIFLMKQFPEGIRHFNQYGRSPLSEALKAKCNIIVKAILDESPELAKFIGLKEHQEIRAAKKAEAAKRRRGMPLPDVVQSSSSFSSEPEQSVKYRSLIETRKSEIICLSNIGMQHSIMDLKKILESLNRRLGCMGAKKRSVAQIAASYLLQERHPPRQDLYQTIKGLNNELMKLERHSPAASREAHASPIISATDTDKEPPRKRARANDNDGDDRKP
jgi:hypothetical protein